jgi:hypothetical protein
MKYMRKTAEHTGTDYTTNAKIATGIKYNHSFVQNTGKQKKLVETY